MHNNSTSNNHNNTNNNTNNSSGNNSSSSNNSGLRDYLLKNFNRDLNRSKSRPGINSNKSNFNLNSSLRVGNDGKVYIGQSNGNSNNITLRKQKEQETAYKPHVCPLSTCRKRFLTKEQLFAHCHGAHSSSK